jgi:hypothetical protein
LPRWVVGRKKGGYSYLQEYLFHAGAANLRDSRITFVGLLSR